MFTTTIIILYLGIYLKFHYLITHFNQVLFHKPLTVFTYEINLMFFQYYIYPFPSISCPVNSNELNGRQFVPFPVGRLRHREPLNHKHVKEYEDFDIFQRQWCYSDFLLNSKATQY